MTTVSNDAIDYFDDVPPPVQEPATLEVLTRLAHESRELEIQIEAETVLLEDKKAKNDRILRVRIPEIMDKLGLEDFKLKDGSEISVKSDVKCGLTEENKPKGFAWLEQENFDGIIKTNVAVSFGKGEVDQAKEAMKALEDAGYHGEMNRSIHPATLKSFVKECLEEGRNIPIDVFGVFEFKQAKIKLPKAKKK